MPDSAKKRRRSLIPAERHTPELLQRFLVDLEATETSQAVWRLLVRLGREVQLPFIDFISANSYRDWKKTLFIRTSYESSWLNAFNANPEVGKWSYFRSHAMECLTPIAMGLEFLDEYRPIPEARVEVLREAARRGIRSGFSIPLRQHAPPQAALITFAGNHARRDMLTIIHAHGWTLTTAAMTAHQRYVELFAQEFPKRNQITGKQLELMELIGAGLQDKQIASELGVSVSAVRQRLQALLQNTGVGSRSELAALAMSLGVLPDPLSRPGGGHEQVVVEMDSGSPPIITPTVR